MKRTNLQNLSVYKTTMFSCIITFLLLITATSCKKSSSANDATTTNLLTSASWKLTKVEWQTTATGAWVDETKGSNFYMPISAVGLTFSDGGGYVANAGLNGSLTGTWKLSSDKSTLTFFTNSATSPSVTVTSLTATTLQMTTALTNVYTVVTNPYTITYYSTERDTYTH